jgi:gluconate 2-dehydrogenase gamma chain
MSRQGGDIVITEDKSRRDFLLASMTGLSAAWFTTNWPDIARAAEMAPGTVATFFTPAQAATVGAMAEQIFPTTDTPGAKEARVLNFIDLALVSFARDSQGLYAKGIADLDGQAKAAGAQSFAALGHDQQVQLLTSIEKTPFFVTVRNHTIMGMFAGPQHGGNYEKVGWKMIGFDDGLNFEAPFGAYDKA